MIENRVRGLIFTYYPTGTAFGKAVGWTRQKVSSIASGKQEPSLDDMYAVANATNKDVDYVASIFLHLKTQICVSGKNKTR